MATQKDMKGQTGEDHDGAEANRKTGQFFHHILCFQGTLNLSKLVKTRVHPGDP
jgi:hypothetical protein